MGSHLDSGTESGNGCQIRLMGKSRKILVIYKQKFNFIVCIRVFDTHISLSVDDDNLWLGRINHVG